MLCNWHNSHGLCFWRPVPISWRELQRSEKFTSEPWCQTQSQRDQIIQQWISGTVKDILEKRNDYQVDKATSQLSSAQLKHTNLGSINLTDHQHHQDWCVMVEKKKRFVLLSRAYQLHTCPLTLLSWHLLLCDFCCRLIPIIRFKDTIVLKLMIEDTDYWTGKIARIMRTSPITLIHIW